MTFQAHGLVSANIITWLFANCSDLDASTETVTKRCCAKKVFFKLLQNSQENTCARFFFLTNLQTEASNFIKKESLARVSSCEFCEIFKNTISYRTPSVAASISRFASEPTLQIWNFKIILIFTVFRFFESI